MKNARSRVAIELPASRKINRRADRIAFERGAALRQTRKLSLPIPIGDRIAIDARSGDHLGVFTGSVLGAVPTKGADSPVDMDKRKALEAMRRLGDELRLATLDRDAEETVRLTLAAIGVWLSIITTEHVDVLSIGRSSEARHRGIERADEVTAKLDDRRRAALLRLARTGRDLAAFVLVWGRGVWRTRARRKRRDEDA